MDVWTLPGPAAFLRRVERSLRDGMSVVVRFPGGARADFRERVLSSLQGSWHCVVFRPESASPPFDSLRARFAPRLSSEREVSLLDLCEEPDFQGRVIWLDGLDRDDWSAWKKFLSDYAHASRGVGEFERTLFVTVLGGVPPADPPDRDVTLAIHDWRGIVDEMDLLFLAYERLGRRAVGGTMRSILATAVARVAAWDLETAEILIDEDDDVMLDPHGKLRAVAQDKGWTADTPVDWEHGTESGNGSLHAAVASLEDPPREIRRRIWSAQVSVLLPVIDVRRREIAQQHHGRLAVQIESEGEKIDPLDLDIGRLTGMVQRPGFDPAVRSHVRRLNGWRNNLAHLKTLSPVAVREIAGS